MAWNSLSTVQAFYDEDHLAVLARRITATPPEQLLELADRLVAGSTASAVVPFGQMADREPAPDAPYVHDVTTQQWGIGNIRTDLVDLKHLILYCDALALPDPLLDWAAHVSAATDIEALGSSGECGRVLAESVTRLKPVAPLVRSGAFRMFAPFHRLGSDSGSLRPRNVGDFALAGKSVSTPLEVAWLEAEQIRVGLEDDDDPDAAVIDHLVRRRGRVRETERWWDELDDSSRLYTIDSYTVRDAADLDEPDTWWRERALNRFVVARCAQSLGWELGPYELDLARPEDWQEIVRLFMSRRESVDYHGVEISRVMAAGRDELMSYFGGAADTDRIADLQGALEFASFTRGAAVVPVCSRDDSARMISLLDEAASADERIFGAPPVRFAGVEFGVPALADVALTDIVRLRMNDSAFHEVREALRQLQDACAAEAPGGGWQEYNRVVARNAEEIVGPAHARLQGGLRRRNAYGRIAGWAASAATRFAFRAVAPTLPAATPFGGVAGAAAARLARRRFEAQDTEIGCRVLLSLLDAR